MKKLNTKIDDVNHCPYCKAEIISQGNSLHCWDIKYECGCQIMGAIGNDDVYVSAECSEKQPVHKK